jgi:hypothetical protein
LVDGIFDESHLTVTNCLEGIARPPRPLGRRADANEPLESSCGGHIKHIG